MMRPPDMGRPRGGNPEVAHQNADANQVLDEEEYRGGPLPECYKVARSFLPKSTYKATPIRASNYKVSRSSRRPETSAVIDEHRLADLVADRIIERLELAGAA